MFEDIICILNRMLAPMNLAYADDKFVLKKDFGHVSICHTLSTDINDMLLFLELPFNLFDLNVRHAYHLIGNSYYYHGKLFRKVKNKKPYDQFLDCLSDFDCGLGYVSISDKEVLKRLKKYLKTDVSSIPPAFTFELSEYRNKFNGHLVRWWTRLEEGPKIANEIKEFISHIEGECSIDFITFVSDTSPSEIRRRFLFYYVDKKIKSMGFVDDLPF